MAETGKRAPVNTTKRANDRPDSVIAEGMAFGPSGAIYRQEVQGQRSLVESDTLPVEMDADDKAMLEAAGVKFLGPVPDDPLFQFVELPEGWRKVPTDHDMWSKLVDETGRKRAMIFYKAAFYDRCAHMSLSARFSTAIDWDRSDREGIGVAHVQDNESVIHTVELAPEAGERSYGNCQKADAAARAWLDEHYPAWRDPGAYWDQT